MNTWQFAPPLGNISTFSISRSPSPTPYTPNNPHTRSKYDFSDTEDSFSFPYTSPTFPRVPAQHSLSKYFSDAVESMSLISSNDFTNCTNSEMQITKPNTWKWCNDERNSYKEKWINFQPIISQQIDDTIHYQWRNTDNNPITFPLTSGSWIGDANNRNIYSVFVFLDVTRTSIIKIYRVNKKTNICHEMKRFTLSSLLPPFVSDYDNQSIKNMNEEIDISQFKFVTKRIEYLVFGYIRRIQKKHEMFSSRNYSSIDVCQICALFYAGINIKIGSNIDVRDRAGKWFLAEIKRHKKIGEIIEFTNEELTRQQRKNVKNLCNLEAVFIHYVGYKTTYDEWIFIEENTICNCYGESISNIYAHRLHRLAAPYTQGMPILKRR